MPDFTSAPKVVCEHDYIEIVKFVGYLRGDTCQCGECPPGMTIGCEGCSEYLNESFHHEVLPGLVVEEEDV